MLLYILPKTVAFLEEAFGINVREHVAYPYEAPGCQEAQASVDEKTFALVTSSLSEVTAL